jgi:hypothetical protein
MFTEQTTEDSRGRKLAHAYVALAMSRTVATRFAVEPNHDASQSLLTLLAVASDLLEEILEGQMPGPYEATFDEPTDDFLM